MTNCTTNDESMTNDEWRAAHSFGLRPTERSNSSFHRRSRVVEKIAFWSFRLATYFIIAATSFIFLDIGVKGARTVFTTTPPFVNVAVPDREAGDAFRLRLRGEKDDVRRHASFAPGRRNIRPPMSSRRPSLIPPAASGPASSAPRCSSSARWSSHSSSASAARFI